MSGDPIYLLFVAAVCAGLWIGLAGLRRSRMNPRDRQSHEWWIMASGATFLALGPVSEFVPSFLLGSGTLRLLGQLSLPAGLLLFAIGFALHGMRMVRLRERTSELEQLTQAMDEEITRLRAQGGRAG